MMIGCRVALTCGTLRILLQDVEEHGIHYMKMSNESSTGLRPGGRTGGRGRGKRERDQGAEEGEIGSDGGQRQKMGPG